MDYFNQSLYINDDATTRAMYLAMLRRAETAEARADELAGEVERLRDALDGDDPRSMLEAVLFQMEDDLKAAQADNAALRAQLDAAGGGWRPVSEPPTQSGYYVTWGDEDARPLTRYYRIGAGDWDQGTRHPTHWRPLPAPPQE